MELYRALDCVGYVGEEPGLPALKVALSEPVGGKKASLTAPVDTGFAGYLLVDRATYEKFGTAELPREFFGAYSTMAGPVVLRRSREMIEVGGVEYETYLESPLYGGGKLLLGRSVLRRLEVALLGNKRSCCLIEEEKSPKP